MLRHRRKPQFGSRPFTTSRQCFLRLGTTIKDDHQVPEWIVGLNGKISTGTPNWQFNDLQESTQAARVRLTSARLPASGTLQWATKAEFPGTLIQALAASVGQVRDERAGYGQRGKPIPANMETRFRDVILT